MVRGAGNLGLQLMSIPRISAKKLIVVWTPVEDQRTVPKLLNSQQNGLSTRKCNLDLPESLLDAVHVIGLPILFGDLLLAHRHAGPVDPHDGDGVDVVLVKLDL